MRRRSAVLPLLLLSGSLVLATAVSAGGMAIVTVTDVPPEPTPGEETTIGLMVMQHGETAVSWPRITVIATEVDSGAVVQAPAEAEGPPGAYVASIVLPAAGDWRLTFDSPDLYMEGSAVLHVPEPVAAAPAVSTPSETSAAVAGQEEMLPVVLGLSFIALAMAAAGLVLRGRRPEPTDVHVASRS